MKGIFLVVALALLSLFCRAEDVTTKSLYILGDFSVTSDKGVGRDGLWRYDLLEDTFFITNTAVDYTLTFYHEPWRGFDHVVVDLPISALEILSSSVVEAAELLKFNSSDDAYNWMLDKKRTCSKIYIIDRCDFYKSSENLSAPDRMKAVEVWIWYNDIPSHLHGAFHFDEFY
jgi:hypothetical protein